MLLEKNFLLQALPGAKFYCSETELTTQSNNWDFYGAEKEFDVSFDSRTASKNSIFFALNGQRVDGHSFVGQAIANGAVAIVVSDLAYIKNINLASQLVILVPDTYAALISLAKSWRKKLNCHIVGITGSIGKTSTKEILRSIMQQTNIPAYFSSKNENTFIGLCAHILNIKTTHQVAALEVGTDQLGEMEIKADILNPTIGLITTISYSHMAQFHNLENIAREKRMLFKNLGDSGIGIIFGDHPLLNKTCYTHPVATFGLKTKNNVYARKIEIKSDNNEHMYTKFTLHWYNQTASVKFNSIHKGMLNNILAASTIAYFLQIPFQSVIKGIECYSAFENRFQFRKIKTVDGMILSDCYNANPDSMKAAIQAFDIIKTKHQKIAVIGDMLELGTRENYWHRQVGHFLANSASIDKIILVGNLVKHVASVLPESFILAKVQNWEEAETVLQNYITEQNSLILVKASHGIALDKLVDSLCEK